ncbi:MAG TPA: tetratricopeptide repeat protein [Xanthomonadales bacterium]|nr:tetratricopeptide repeat protein [Xanthomonadales bacterium]
MSFFAELKRRNVYRVAVLYVIVGWLVLQVTDVTMSLLALPEWTGRLVFVLLALGFPIALVLAWAFELTPEGLRREREAPATAAPEQPRRNRLDYLIVFALLAALGWFAWQHDWQDAPDAQSPGDIRSLVVLPLDNLTNDPDQAYFVAGMHEALITELSRIGSLRVISRTSAMRYRDANKSVPEIGRELDVDAVIEGSVLKVGDVVRITVQLIEAESDRHLWAANFDRPLRDILALYGEVTGEIAKQIRVTLSPDHRADISATAEVDPEVYDLYIRGRYLCDNWSPGEMAQGITLLEEALERGPGNASANAQLALCLQYSAFFGYSRPLDVQAEAHAAARRAIELDPELVEGHVAMAGVHYYLDLNPRDAIESLDRALELNPANVRALVHASWLLGEAGRFEEAYEYNRQVLSLDPFSTLVLSAMGQVYYLDRKYEEAIGYFQRSLELDRNDPSMHYYVARTREQQGRFEEAIELHRRAVALSNGASIYRAALGYSLGLAGQHEEAEAILEALSQDPATSPYDLAIVHLGLGHLENAIGWLERAYEARDAHVIYINREAKFDPLRDMPRFKALLDKLDFPDADNAIGE